MRDKFFEKTVCLVVGSMMTVSALLLISKEVGAERAIPDDNLAYPALLTLGSGVQGSGFFLNLETGTVLVAARHVLFKEGADDLHGVEAEIRSYSKAPKETGGNIFLLDLGRLQRDGNIKRHTTHDVAVIRIGKPISGDEPHVLKLLDGVTVKELTRSGILGVAENTVKKFEDVLVANQVFIFGFPTSIGLKNIPQIDYAKPLLRTGIVAGTNEKARTILLDCPVYQGNSGGPVLEVEDLGFGKKFRIIGVVSQFVPVIETWRNMVYGYTNINISNSGYAIAIPMDFVLELTSQFASSHRQPSGIQP